LRVEVVEVLRTILTAVGAAAALVDIALRPD
jgi:hypothetical protein